MKDRPLNALVDQQSAASRPSNNPKTPPSTTECALNTTCYNRFNRWRKSGVWDRLMDAIVEAYDGDIQMIDSSSVRVHQHAAGSKRGVRIVAWVVPAED